MTLYELFHPLVSYMVVNRDEAAAGRMPDKDVLLGHIMRELASIRKTGAASPNLADGLEDACTYTAFYIDYMVHEGNFPFERDWQDLGRTMYNELAGDEKFFDYMCRWLDDDTPMAKDHLRLMHAMVASGFSGVLERRSMQLEELMRRTAEKLHLPDEQKAKEALFDESKKQFAMNVFRKPTLGVGIVTVSCALVLGLAIFHYIRTYRVATSSLLQVLDKTGEHIRLEATLHAQNSDRMVVQHVELDKQTIRKAEEAPPAANRDASTEQTMPDPQAPRTVEPPDSVSTPASVAPRQEQLDTEQVLCPDLPEEQYAQPEEVNE